MSRDTEIHLHNLSNANIGIPGVRRVGKVMTEQAGTIVLYVCYWFECHYSGHCGFRLAKHTILHYNFSSCVLLVPWTIVGILRVISGPDPFYIIAFLFVLMRTWYIPFVVCIPALAIGTIRRSDILTS